MREEIQRTQDIMFRLTGRRGRLFRPPYGECDARLLRVADGLGLETVKWEVVSGDPDPNVTAAKMVRAIVNRTRNGSVIIMHMNGRGRHTAEALPAVIRQLGKAGYRFVTVGELLDLASKRDPAVPRTDARK
jgi:peptidoglycan/xylan/chitin deacetylase (PgdA/CDA1 family)